MTDTTREVRTPAQHRALGEALLTEAGALALAAQIAAERAQLHGILAAKAGTGDAYEKADGAAAELAAMAERGELGPEALSGNWLMFARQMAERADEPGQP